MIITYRWVMIIAYRWACPALQIFPRRKGFCFRFLEIVTKLGLENLKPGVWNFEFWRVAKVDLVLDQVAYFLDLLILDQVPWKLCPLVF